jgi:hypothetical protein
MKLRWDVDDNTLVEAKLGSFGRSKLTVNGKGIPGKLSLRKKNEIRFAMSDGRLSTVSVKPQFGTQPIVELRVDDRLMVETGKEPIKCSSCKAVVNPNDLYCEACGKSLPPPETYSRLKHVKQATGAITTLSVLFFIFGILMFFVTKSQDAALLAKLDGMDPAANFPKAINGVTYTVAALRERVVYEPWGALIVNFILAAIMGGLAFWGKRSPLPAVLVATATYLVVNVTNAILDPMTIGQGIYLKIFIIVFLVRGIKAALALRTENA